MPRPSGERTKSRWWWVPRLILIAAAWLPSSGVFEAAHAQEAALLKIAHVEHDPLGVVVAEVLVGLDAAGSLEMTALVDGVPHRVTSRDIEPVPPVAIVLAIDTSGSMAGAPIVAAREAAIRLVRELGPDDEVALVTFSDRPRIVRPFTTDHGGTIAAILGVTAAGGTALYDSVVTASSLLLEKEDVQRALVLLSDGHDSGASTEARELSLEAAAKGDLTAYAFAFGSDADLQYLSAVASSTGGAMWEVSDDGALLALFAELGSRLSATIAIRIPVPPLAIGTHRLALRMSGEGGVQSVEHDFEVTNAGVLSPRVTVPADPTDAIRVAIESAVPSEAIRVSASLGGRALSVLPGETPVVLIDPWQESPGRHAVRIDAVVSGARFAGVEVEVEVPRLPPTLRVQQTGDGEIVADARYQPGVARSLVALADGREVARVEGFDLTVTAPGAAEVRIELRGPADEVVQSEALTFALPDAEITAPSRPLTVPLLISALALGVVVALMLRRRARPRATVIRNRPLGVRAPGLRRNADVVVREPTGAERRYPLGSGPFTVGRSPDCDVVIDGEGVRPFHVRISPSGEGRFQVHGMAPRSGRPYQAEPDEWLVIAAGESIEVGDHILSIQVDAAAATNGRSHGAG